MTIEVAVTAPDAVTPAGKRSFAVWLAIAWVAVVVLAAVCAPILPLRPVDEIVDGLDPRLAPFSSWTEPLGTDSIGRSTLSRLVFGARQSMLVGTVAITAALVCGLVIGVCAGYVRRAVDRVTGVVVDAVLAIPPLVLLLAIAAVGRRGAGTIALGLAVVCTPSIARLARAQTLQLAARPHVTASRSLGATGLRIVVRDLLPEVALRIAPYAFLLMAYVIISEASLNFLGLGVPPPTPSWGGMINDGRPYLADEPWLVFVPSLTILLTVVSFTVLGDRFRSWLDEREGSR